MFQHIQLINRYFHLVKILCSTVFVKSKKQNCVVVCTERVFNYFQISLSAKISFEKYNNYWSTIFHFFNSYNMQISANNSKFTGQTYTHTHTKESNLSSYTFFYCMLFNHKFLVSASFSEYQDLCTYTCLFNRAYGRIDMVCVVCV